MKQKATIYLDGQLWREFRAACLRRGKSASAVIEMAIHDQMLHWAAEQGRADIAAGRFVEHDEFMQELDRAIDGADPVDMPLDKPTSGGAPA